jgi:hypothetical protein
MPEVGVRAKSLSRRAFAVGVLGAAAARGLAHRWQPVEITDILELDSLAGGAFVREQARRIVRSAFLPAQSESHGHRNTTPYDLHVPGGNMGYPAFWVRDAAMMLGGDLIPASEIEGWIRLVASVTSGPEARVVRAGVTVPPYTVPDHVTFDARACFFPGSFESGDKQGGPPWGHTPPLDDNFYFLSMVYEHWRLTRELSLWRGPVGWNGRDIILRDLCERVYAGVACDPSTGLVTAGDPDAQNAKDWGFCDAVFKSGALLFPSVLKFIAARQMSELLRADGDQERAASYTAGAESLARAISSTLLRGGTAGDEAWLHSATGVGNQADVWGTALAVTAGVIGGDDATRAARSLVRAYREQTAVRDGMVRHLLTTDTLNNGAWERAVCAAGEYQNGGYWWTPVGWYIAAMHIADAQAAGELAREFVTALRTDRRPDGLSHAWEWRNPQTGANANPLYVASVALPFLSLQRAGLAGLLDQG